MPPPPFHFGPPSVLGLALLRYAYLPAVLLGSLAPDLQPPIILLLNLSYSWNGPILHSLVGSTLLLTLPLTALIFVLQKPLERVTSILKLYQKPTLLTVVTGILIGVYSHILLDAYLYTDIQPFYPFDMNPLLSQSESRYLELYITSTITLIIALLMYGFYRWKKYSTKKPDKEPSL